MDKTIMRTGQNSSTKANCKPGSFGGKSGNQQEKDSASIEEHR